MNDLELEISKLEGISFHLEKGNYQVCFIGGFYLLIDSKIGLTSINSRKRTIITEYKLKTRFYRKRNRGIKYGKFIVEESGDYKIDFKNLNSIIMKKSRLFSLRLFQKEISHDKITLLIKKI